MMASNSISLKSMQTKPYDFETQRKVGQEGETFLDQWLHPIYKVLDVSGEMKYQQAGIDRVVTRSDGSVITIEYKFDLAAKRTGNLFFETISNDKEMIPGWGWSSQADYWIVLIPEQEIRIFQNSVSIIVSVSFGHSRNSSFELNALKPCPAWMTPY